MSRKGLTKETDGTREARAENTRLLTEDARFQRLNATDRRHMKALLTWHDPLTGYLGYRTRALNLMKVLDVSEETLRRSRLRLIARGLIVSYEPGTGHTASTYCIARSWAEAEEAVELRRRPDAPHFPELVNRTPSAVDGRPAAPAAAEEDQEPEETREERAEARERLGRVRRRQGVKGPVPPELPATPGPELKPEEIPALLEIAERSAGLQHLDVIKCGVALVRAEIRRAPNATSGAA